MSLELENIGLGKPVCLPEEYALKLKRLATTFAVTETSLLQEALDLLFQREFEADALADWEYLKEIEAELGPLPPRPSGFTINPADIVSIVGTPIDPKSIRRRGEPC